MKMKKFNEYHPVMILGDIYKDTWIFKIISLKILQTDTDHLINPNHTEKR